VLHNISPSTVEHDIYIFLEYNLRLIAQKHRLQIGWPGPDAIAILVQKASGLFIWAATACRFLEDGKKRWVIRNRLPILGTSKSIAEPSGPEKQLDRIYTIVLTSSIPAEFSYREREELLNNLRSILGSIVNLLSPLSAHSLSRLLDIEKDNIEDGLDGLHAILDIPKDHTCPLRLHHPSFRDFLLSQDRCIDSNFWVDEKQAHQRLADSCIQLMSSSLAEDICDVTIPGTYVTEVERRRIEQFLPYEVQYACLYWIEHLQRSCIQLQDNDQVHKFLQRHLLHWLEALSWMQKMSEGILNIISLESIALVSMLMKFYIG
jgi:hypothetical protein